AIEAAGRGCDAEIAAASSPAAAAAAGAAAAAVADAAAAPAGAAAAAASQPLAGAGDAAGSPLSARESGLGAPDLENIWDAAGPPAEDSMLATTGRALPTAGALSTFAGLTANGSINDDAAGLEVGAETIDGAEGINDCEMEEMEEVTEETAEEVAEETVEEMSEDISEGAVEDGPLPRAPENELSAQDNPEPHTDTDAQHKTVANASGADEKAFEVEGEIAVEAAGGGDVAAEQEVAEVGMDFDGTEGDEKVVEETFEEVFGEAEVKEEVAREVFEEVHEEAEVRKDELTDSARSDRTLYPASPPRALEGDPDAQGPANPRQPPRSTNADASGADGNAFKVGSDVAAAAMDGGDFSVEVEETAREAEEAKEQEAAEVRRNVEGTQGGYGQEAGVNDVGRNGSAREKGDVTHEERVLLT
ncbi:unnamed protein product, partial [Prorocentrum cordatum]